MTKGSVIIPLHFALWNDGNKEGVLQASATHQTNGHSSTVVDKPLRGLNGGLKDETVQQNVHYLQVPDLDDKTELTIEKDFIAKALGNLNKNIKALILNPPANVDFTKPFEAFNFGFALGKLLEMNHPFQYRDAISRAKTNIETVLIDSHYERTNVDPFNPRTDRQIWIRLPLYLPEGGKNVGNSSISVDEIFDKVWEWWSNLRKIAGTNPKLGVVLDFGKELPKDLQKLNRWFGERLRASILPDAWTKAPSKNGDGLQLSQGVQVLLQELYRIPHNSIFLRGGDSDATAKQLYLFQQFEQFKKSLRDPRFYEEMVALPDNPCNALQPLKDHLANDMYALFEQATKKYLQYHLAIYTYLSDRKAKGLLKEPVIGMVVGAGRGPLATEFIKVVTLLNLQWKVYCVDKNPIAIEQMKVKLETEWKQYKNNITVVFSDMRQFQPVDRADILISELIGPFACNECSPECLDGAQHLLKPDGISVPSGYDSYLQPVMSIPYSDDILTFSPPDRHLENEMATVSTRNMAVISKYQKAWGFIHPNFEPHSNERESRLTFVAEGDYILTGFTGHFDMLLYKDIAFNILPDRQTADIFNWFPAYFCLPKAVPVKKGQSITIHIARRVKEEEGKVWYEWALLSPEVLPLQNFKPDYWLGLQTEE